MELIIEQLSRSRKVLSRHKVHGPHVAIGRAYDNDVILNDPYVCPHHLFLTINQEGRWLVKDEGSVNGSYVEHEPRLNHPRPVRSGEVVSVGKSYLRFIYPNHPVTQAIRLSGIDGLLNWLSNPVVVALVLLFYLTLKVGSFYMGSAVEIKTPQLFWTLFGHLTIASFLPLMFALLARLFKHDARVLTQLVVWYSFFTVFLLVDGIGALIKFNSSQPWMSSAFMYITEIVMIFALLWSAFYIAFHQSPLRRTIMTGGLTAGIVAVLYLWQASNSVDFHVKPIYDNTLLAPEFAISEPVSIKQFISQSEAIFELGTEQVAKKER